MDRFDRAKEIFTRKVFTKNFDSVIGYNGVHSIYEDQQGIFWLGTMSGLIQMNREADTVKYYRHIPDDINSLSKGEVILIYEDNSENIWAATFGGTLNKLSRKTGKIRRFFSTHNIHNLWQDSEGILWVGTSKGLYRSNTDLSSFTKFTGPNSEFTGNLIVNAILEDDKRNLWISASEGICRLNPERNKVSIFSRNGDPAWYNGTGKFKGKNGELFFGGGGGYFTFFPDQIIGNNEPPTIVFNEFQLADQTILADKEGPLKEPLFQAKEINLIHNQDAFSINFAGIHYSNPKQNPHLFILEGLDNTWRKAGEEKTAYYYNVPPGNYTFRVRAANSDGVWAEKNIGIVILPPWWSTWWAYILYVGVVIVFMYGFRLYTVNRERLKHELKLQRLETEKMHEIDHLKSRFFANISHEFRTPLTLILGPIDKFLARSPKDHPDQPAYLMMQRNARRLQQLINHLLDLSKLEAGSMKLDLKPADLIAFLKAMVFAFTSHAETKKIQYHFKYPHDHPVVYFDADKLEKIITNLLSNAFKFTKPGGKIIVTALIETADKKSLPDTFSDTVPSSTAGMLELRVEDSGVGIPRDQLDRIFDRFYQADTSHTREQEGTGIGLSLVRELVELHSGEIRVESQPGHGSCFTVRLPVLLADFEEIAITGPALNNDQKIIDPIIDDGELISSPNAATVKDGPEAPLVLIIEDNADVRSFIREALQPLYHVLEAGDGEAGYRQAVKTIPDLILSDVMMPKMDGVELCGKLKENVNTAHIPIILLTAKASGGDKIEGLETGADDYLIKPFEAAELMVRIKNLIDSRKKLREIFSKEITLQPTSVVVSSVDGQFLQRIMLVIEEHIADDTFGVEEFGREAGMSKTQLFRKLKALTNHAPGDFIRIMRLKRAADLLSKGSGSIAEVAFQVGFNDPSYFTKCFQKEFGKTPSEFVATKTVPAKPLFDPKN